ncbi:homoserine kinase [Emcibacter nanhaiensis]|uniref:Homoserine kinase n=1 Tax=Emcibacter nanhaiensis TaxID=1505037 RepID=A0A501PNB7_9PROT|nr:homoserine kinase [Emcibacter nanhaiensis]TPD61929.1 homoserine kinase [Emcibacter nanhaiensis]
MAVYTQVTAEEINAFIAQYDVGEVVSFKGIAEGSENSNYFLQTTEASFILTLFEARVNEADLPFFMGLMDHLNHKDIVCATPVRDRAGNNLKTLCGRPAALITFLNGMAINKPQPEHCRQLGGELARMHLAAADFNMSRANDLSVDGWEKLVADCADGADRCAPGLREILTGEQAFLKDNWPTDLPAGIIHADLFPDNVFFLEGKLSGLIDYYFACNDFLAYDLAVCMNSWCFEADGSFNVTKSTQLLKGYNDVRPLEARELDALPLLCRGAALRFLLTRLYDWLNRVEGALVQVKDPTEYLTKLTFHQGVRNASAYGLDIK